MLQKCGGKALYLLARVDLPLVSVGSTWEGVVLVVVVLLLRVLEWGWKQEAAIRH
jgi:hypothetical protein